MKSFFVFSTVAHGMLLASLVVLGTLLSKPRMSYYAVDLVSSLPAGGPMTVPSQSPAAIATPKVVAAPKVAAPSPAAEEEVPAEDTIRLLAKLKKKRLTQAKKRASASEETSIPSAPAASGRGGIGLPGSGAGIVAEAGTAFPYPWYLKTIADRLDKQWKPPQEFQPDTVCQVTFLIDRGGNVTGSEITKSSGDQLFDQLALRAVLYANPLPPLPNGFPDESLKVHMKFVGRRL
jgi:protein TonB